MRANRLWLISYDIADDDLRLAVEKALIALGDKVQFSVFECWLHADAVSTLLQRFQPDLDPDTDSIRAYPLCQWCEQKVDWQGQGQKPADPAFWII